MIALQPIVTLPNPVKLCLSLPDPEGPRSEQDTWAEFAEFPLHLQVNCLERTIIAYLPPIPLGLELYAPEDFAAACADGMDDHCEQVLRTLGADPAATLQALIDGDELPPIPQRIPREVAHWRMEYILGKRGLLDRLDAVIANLPDAHRELALAAWKGLAAIRRNSPLILLAAPLLDLTPAQTDELFIACESLPA